MPHRLTTERLALFATLLATFGELHPACDHWAQGSKTASRKRLYGEDRVHADGTPAVPDSTRPTMTTSELGRRAVACHVTSLGLEDRVNAEGTMFSPVGGVNSLVSGVRQVSWRMEASLSRSSLWLVGVASDGCFAFGSCRGESTGGVSVFERCSIRPCPVSDDLARGRSHDLRRPDHLRRVASRVIQPVACECRPQSQSAWSALTEPGRAAAGTLARHERLVRAVGAGQ